MPLQNRVTPLSHVITHPARGHVYGNRGCLHNANGEIVRFAATRRWISCRLCFKDRHRDPRPQPGRYTGLFFLDEATAFAAGHRPCALCRREDYNAAKSSILTAEVSSDDFDSLLQAERMDGTRRRLQRADYQRLPDGAFVIVNDAPHLILNDAVRQWSPSGYGCPKAKPRGMATLLTPPSLVLLLHEGWHGAVPLIANVANQCPPSRPPT